MSRKAPKKYGKQAPQKSTATAEEARQARRVVTGIAIGILAIMGIIILAYNLFA